MIYSKRWFMNPMNLMNKPSGVAAHKSFSTSVTVQLYLENISSTQTRIVFFFSGIRLKRDLCSQSGDESRRSHQDAGELYRPTQPPHFVSSRILGDLVSVGDLALILEDSTVQTPFKQSGVSKLGCCV